MQHRDHQLNELFKNFCAAAALLGLYDRCIYLFGDYQMMKPLSLSNMQLAEAQFADRVMRL